MGGPFSCDHFSKFVELNRWYASPPYSTITQHFRGSCQNTIWVPLGVDEDRRVEEVPAFQPVADRGRADDAGAFRPVRPEGPREVPWPPRLSGTLGPSPARR